MDARFRDGRVRPVRNIRVWGEEHEFGVTRGDMQRECTRPSRLVSAMGEKEGLKSDDTPESWMVHLKVGDLYLKSDSTPES